jgi:putative oxidoreductase
MNDVSSRLRDMITRLYRPLIALGNILQHAILLVFRLNWGWQFFQTGQGKLINHEHTTEFFSSLQIPLPGLNAWMVGGLECIGGLLLLLGLATRPTALLLFLNMTVAYLSVPDDRAKLFHVFSDPTPFLSADPFFFWLTALLLLAFGPGLISVDALVSKALHGVNSASRTGETGA